MTALDEPPRRSRDRVRRLPLLRGVRDALRRHPRATAIGFSVVAAAILVAVLYGRRDEFATALTRASIPVLLLATLLQISALLSRTEAWHRTIEAAGGTVPRRALYQASSMGYVSSIVSSQLGAAARIAALRRSSPATSPKATTLVAAEMPIMAIEVGLAAIASFTVMGPMGWPWWLPFPIMAVTALAAAGLRRLGHRSPRPLWQGLAVLGRLRPFLFVLFFVLGAVLSQIARNWLLLNAVGVSASPLDATAVLIAMVLLSLLPVGPSAGAGAVVLILGQNGVAAAAAAGLLATVTGTVGGLAFAGWAAGDHLWGLRRLRGGEGSSAAGGRRPPSEGPRPRPGGD
ncbi:MAG TPA: lysylphosphatidylglycerol synthase domain-containing protein [Baekduia sp.]|nr:lysylphosphatidylglycerol synthase domain-containing protein [Baekduia sp.]